MRDNNLNPASRYFGSILLCWVITSTGCGQKSEPSPSDEAARYHLALTADLRAEQLISWHLKDGDQILSQGQDDSPTQFRDKMTLVKVDPEHELSFVLTVKDAAGQVLASNLKSAIDQDPRLLSIWDTSCAAVSPLLVPAKDGRMVSSPIYKAVEIKLTLCDFQASTVLTSEQDATAEAETVFECSAPLDKTPSLDNILEHQSSGPAACKPGYTLPATSAIQVLDFMRPAGQEKKISAPVRLDSYDPFTVYFGTNLLTARVDDPGMKYKLDPTEFDELDFGKLGYTKSADCYGFEVQIFWNEGGGLREGRLAWIRTVDRDSPKVWLPKDQSPFPKKAELQAAVRADNGWNQIKFWLHCRWYPKNPTDIQML